MLEFKYPEIVNFSTCFVFIVREKLVHDSTGETIVRCDEAPEGPAGIGFFHFASAGAIERVESHSATFTANNRFINFL